MLTLFGRFLKKCSPSAFGGWPTFLTVIFPIAVILPELFAQPLAVEFESFKIGGIPQGRAEIIFQDSFGFIWFGRSNGMYKYDGYDKTIYQSEANDSASLSNNFVKAIAEDKAGNLWIGTEDGLNQFNPATGKCRRFQHDPADPHSLSHNCISAIFFDSEGTMWIGTEGGGLNEGYVIKDEASKTGRLCFKHYFHDPADSTSLNDSQVHCIASENGTDGEIIYVGTANGLFVLEKTNGKFSRHYLDAPSTSSLSANIIWTIGNDGGKIWLGTAAGLFQIVRNNAVKPEISFLKFAVNAQVSTLASDSANRLWIGTFDQRLFCLNKQTDQLIHYPPDPADPAGLGHQTIVTVMVDKAGALWVSSQGGIFCYDPQKYKIKQHAIEPSLPNWLGTKSIYALIEDRDGSLWVGTRGEGMDKYDPRTGKIASYTHDPHRPQSLCCPWVISLYEDRRGFIWVGTTNGLDRFDRKTETFIHYIDDPANPLNPDALSSDYIAWIHEDKDGALWLATGRGIDKFDHKTGKFNHYLIDADQINLMGHYIGFIFEDSYGTLLIGSKGLFQFNPETGRFIPYSHDPSDPNYWIGDVIGSIHEDRHHNLWIATYGNGLYRLDRNKQQLHFTETEGIPSNFVFGILEDDEGFLWISTFKGLIKLDPRDNSFQQQIVKDEWGYNEFSMRAFHKGRSGCMYFGNLRGFISFYPQRVVPNPYRPPVWIAVFKIFAQPVGFDKPISELNHIHLTHKQNVFSFEFVALSYTDSYKNQYAYKMEGFDQDWIQAGTRRDATYTNLDPGKYTFRVRGSNNDGIWNEAGASVRIIISPPWWRTIWAYALYVILLGSIMIGLWRFQVRRIQIRNELQMKTFETQKLQEIDSLKSRFFANISHEFRTPLTLILGPLGKMLAQTKSKEKKKEIKLMQRNAQRLQRLINQLLDLSKIEAGKMTLHTRPENIVALLNRIVQSFESQAKLKGIELKFQSELDEIIAYIDRDKIENIFYNLLSNALKFTSQGGTVACEIQFVNSPAGNLRQMTDDLKSKIVISVTDTGIGIPLDRLDKVFDRFYQVDDSYTREHEGSGIGLALTKELVELHHGKIAVQSELNKGTTFTVYLPLGKEHLKPEEIVEEAAKKPPAGLEPAGGLYIDESASADLQPSGGLPGISRRKAIPIVLIVEDNRDMRSYLKDCLASEYRVIEAVDGEAGLKTSIDKIPDLIISDVMMPKMDGFQLCQRLKTDERISHIPIILLTARAEIKDKIDGLEFGADDYIIKPFDTKELQVRVKNLIEQRRLLRQKFSQQTAFVPDEIATTPVDISFLNKAKHIVEGHIADEQFSVESLAKNIGMSRSQLHRKLRALTDRSTSEFIRTLRLQRAAYLLQQRRFSVTEVAFEVGFNNPSYFAACFRKQFGKLPSEYMTSI